MKCFPSIFTSAPQVLACLGLLGAAGMGAWGNYSQASASGEQKMREVVLISGIGGNSSRHVEMRPPSRRPSLKLNAQPRRELSTERINREAKAPEITVAKSGADYEYVRAAAKPSWRCLTRSVRRQIDAAKVRRNRWQVVVIHSSATQMGSAASFDYYHRVVKGMEHGLAYHFVIGNGHGAKDGEVQVGPRWKGQQPGGHLRSESQNEVAIGICLVGNFEKNRPSERQIEALDELIDYLQAKVGKIRVTTHRRINVRPTLCPGHRFPEAMFLEPKG